MCRMGWDRMVIIGHRSSKSTFGVENIISYVFIELTFSLLYIAVSFLLKAKARFHMSAPPGESPCSLCLARPSGQLWENSTFWSGRIRRTPVLSWFHSYLISRPPIFWQHLVVLWVSDYFAKKEKKNVSCSFVFVYTTLTQRTTFAAAMAPLWRLCLDGRLAEVSTEHTSLQHPMWTFYLLPTS